MNPVCLHDKKILADFLARHVYLHIYSIGDLDEFFWPYTVWYGLKNHDQLQAVVLLYVGQSLPVLLALADDLPAMRELLQSVLHILPGRFYAHLSPGLEPIFTPKHRLDSYGEHYKMALVDKSGITTIECREAARLNTTDEPAIKTLYAASYPGNWFDPRMLETNQYFGIWQDHQLVSIAGIHVYSPQYGVSALGNITTLPSCRGKGYGRLVTAKLCQSLLESGIQHIGLNVSSDNKTAIRCYEKLGFEVTAAYHECLIRVT